MVVVKHIEAGDVSDATTDGALLDDAGVLVLQATNLRTGAIALEHLDATRAAAAAGRNLPLTTWVDSMEALTGDHAISNAVAPGDLVSPGGTDLELTPPVGGAGTLSTGDVLRWWFTAVVKTVDFAAAPEADYYHLTIEVDGTDDNGAATVTSLDVLEALGIPSSFSMNAGRVVAAALGAGIDRGIAAQRLAFEGTYVHVPDVDAVFSVAGGDVHIDALRVRCWVEDAGNSVTLKQGRLTAMICKG